MNDDDDDDDIEEDGIYWSYNTIMVFLYFAFQVIFHLLKKKIPVVI